MRALCFILILNIASFSDSYKILGLFPFPASSHQAIYDSLMIELANRGHDVVVYTTFPKNSVIKNYKNVDIGKCTGSAKENEISTSLGFANNIKTLISFFHRSPDYEDIANCKPLMDLLNLNTSSYDLLITEIFNTDVFLIFAHKLGIPYVGMAPNNFSPWATAWLGNPNNPSYMSQKLAASTQRMNFLERIHSSYSYIMCFILYKYVSVPRSNEIVTKLLGSEAPDDIEDIARNMSLLFIYADFHIIGVRPLVPAIVEIGGLNIGKPASLPKDIEKFINESEHGVVYFCMGSLLQGSSFPPEKRDAFLKAFSRIKQRVLWKWEGELPGKSDNIMTAKWMPQRDILAHKNVKLFISHGGLLGTSEAVYEAVPIIGIPIFGDQRTNVRSIEAAGAGELLDYNEISEDVVYEKIQKVLNNPSYRENAKELSRRYKDRPMSPMDTAVYWTEYVIRHKGAYHLRSAAVDLSWYQYLLLDVIAVVLLAAVIVIVALYLTVKFILKSIARILGLSSKPVIKKAKVN